MDYFALFAGPALLAGFALLVYGSVTGGERAAVFGTALIVVVWYAYGMGA